MKLHAKMRNFVLCFCELSTNFAAMFKWLIYLSLMTCFHGEFTKVHTLVNSYQFQQYYTAFKRLSELNIHIYSNIHYSLLSNAQYIY